MEAVVWSPLCFLGSLSWDSSRYVVELLGEKETEVSLDAIGTTVFALGSPELEGLKVIYW